MNAVVFARITPLPYHWKRSHFKDIGYFYKAENQLSL